MWLPLLGLTLGLVFGLLTNIEIPTMYEDYLTIALLAALDTLFGGIRAHLQNEYNDKVFISGFIFNIALAIGLAFIGVHLGIDLYLAAIFAFGVRLFQNISIIRRIFIIKWETRDVKKREKNV